MYSSKMHSLGMNKLNIFLTAKQLSSRMKSDFLRSPLLLLMPLLLLLLVLLLLLLRINSFILLNLNVFFVGTFGQLLSVVNRLYHY